MPRRCRAKEPARSGFHLLRAEKRFRGRERSHAAAWPCRPSEAALPRTRRSNAFLWSWTIGTTLCFVGSSGSASSSPSAGTTGPSAGRGIDAEAENALFLAPSQPLVEPADGSAPGRSSETRSAAISRLPRPPSRQAGRRAPARRNTVCISKPCRLPILIIGGDPLGGSCLDIVDAQHVADRMDAAHWRVAGVAPFRLVVADARRHTRHK